MKKIERDYLKDNNVSIIKFLLSYLVIFSHSFPITLTTSHTDPINVLTKGQLDLGNFSVCVFLFFSGFFVTKSVLNSKNAKDFFLKRILKIIPPLFIVLLFTVFIVGPIFKEISLKDYFSNSTPYLYLLKNTFLITTHKIKGLFISNPYNLSPNGSLWTLPVEFICYLICFIFFKLNLLNKRNIKITFLPFILFFIFQNFAYEFMPILSSVMPLFMLFYIGMLFYIYRDKIIVNHYLGILSVVILISSMILNKYFYVKIFMIPYMIFWLSMSFKIITNKILKKVSSISYEIYLLGFLIQQIVVSMTKIYNPYINFIVTIIPVFICAYLLNKANKFVIERIKV